VSEVRVIRAGQLSAETSQSGGMDRRAAVSADLVGSRALWMGETRVAPSTAGQPHHHGQSETGIYVVSGTPVFSFRDARGELVRLETYPGDYIYVPPHVPHIEENPSSDEDAVVVIARTTQDAIVVNLTVL
jgi:uncharacterized RmlC-like cupin family protein